MKKIDKSAALIIGLILVGVVGWYYYGQNSSTEMNTGTNEPSEPISISYGEIKVTYGNNGDNATVIHDGEIYELDRAISASGARYANSDETVVLWEHQGEVTLEIGGQTVVSGDAGKESEPEADRYDFVEPSVDSVTTPGSMSNPAFQENELGGEMILPQNPSDETSDATATDHDAIIGMSVDQANNYADRLGVDFRTGTIDGEPQALTMDYRVGRITAEITDGIVVGYTVEE